MSIGNAVDKGPFVWYFPIWRYRQAEWHAKKASFRGQFDANDAGAAYSNAVGYARGMFGRRRYPKWAEPVRNAAEAMADGRVPRAESASGALLLALDEFDRDGECHKRADPIALMEDRGRDAGSGDGREDRS